MVSIDDEIISNMKVMFVDLGYPEKDADASISMMIDLYHIMQSNPDSRNDIIDEIYGYHKLRNIIPLEKEQFLEFESMYWNLRVKYDKV